MNSYETMFIVKPDLDNESREAAFKDVTSLITKGKGKITNQQTWAEKRKMTYPIKKYQEGTYYLVEFDINPSEIVKLRQSWRLNESVLRFQILKLGEK